VNGVILSPGANGRISRQFWKRVTDMATGIDVPARCVPRDRSRSRSSRRQRLVHHNSPHKNVFGTLPEIVECMCWTFGLKALGNMLETSLMLRSRWNKKCFQHVPELPNKCTQHMLQQFPVVSLICSCAVACNPRKRPAVRPPDAPQTQHGGSSSSSSGIVKPDFSSSSGVVLPDSSSSSGVVLPDLQVIVAALAAALRLATMPRAVEPWRRPLAIVYNPRLVPQGVVEGATIGHGPLVEESRREQPEPEQPRLVGHKSPHTDVWGIRLNIFDSMYWACDIFWNIKFAIQHLLNTFTNLHKSHTKFVWGSCGR
jgi:hypothetical protein